MSVVINTNIAATQAAINFSASSGAMRQSLSRLSSGSKIVQPADDAGGLAVSLKMSATIKRTAAVQANVSNAISYLQTQDGALKTAGDILNRMSQLMTLYSDVTKSTSDKDNYKTEFSQLQQQLSGLDSGNFNGVSLFAASSAQTLSVVISEDGGRSVAITKPFLNDASVGKDYANVKNTSRTLDGTGGNGISLAMLTHAIQEVATFRAENGAYSSRLQFASSILTVNQQNLESANSQIVDVDIAAESTAYAKNNILVQSGAAMLAQANASSQVAVKLIG